LRTDLVGKVYSFDVGGTYTDDTAEAQTPSGFFTVGWGAGDVERGDALYIGHPDVLWDKVRMSLVSAVTGGTISTGVWEYYDGNLDQGNPTSVVNLGPMLRINCNSILGTADRSGTVVRVRCNSTGGYADLVVAYSGGENRIFTLAGANAFLGQPVPSIVVADYIIGTGWRELPDVTDETSNFSIIGTKDVSFALPQTLTANWRKISVGVGGLAFSAYWIRFRVINVTGTPNPPSINEIRIVDGNQYAVVVATQGKSRSDNPLGSSDGSADQEFILSNSPVIDDAFLRVYADEGTEREYIRADNFLNSLSTDRHFTVEYDDDGIATIAFGDGVNGKIPPSGVDNIRATYRTMDEINGNVGANSITVNRSGIAYISNPTNPRGASGYAAKEGSTDEDLARLKVAGPATLRSRERAVSPSDAESVAIGFVASDGSAPVKRALAIEEGFGPKTVETVVVGSGGAQVQASKLQEIQDYFNGTDTETGKILLNSQATVSNFTPRVIDIVATVYGGNLAVILTALTSLLNPLTAKSDGTFLWEFGGTVPISRLIQEIMNTSGPRNSVIATPSADVALGRHELPTVGTLSIVVVP
jgi:hypothetical protein